MEGQEGVVNSNMIEDGSIAAGDLAENYVGTSGGTVSGSLNVGDLLSVGPPASTPIYNSIGVGVPESGQMNNNWDLFVQDDLEVGNELFADSITSYGSIFIGTDDDDDTIYMDGSREYIRWEEMENRFYLSDDLYI